MDTLHLIIIFIAGILSGIINTLAGGGSTLTVPLLIFLGVPPVVANGTNRIAILTQCFTAILGFKKYHLLAIVNTKMYIIPSILGAFVGSFVGAYLPDTLFKKIFALFMFFALLSLFIKKDFQRHEKSQNHFILPSLFFAIGLYGGIIQVGVGFVIIVALSSFSHMNLKDINVVKTVVVFCYTIIAVAIFAWMQKVDWFVGFVLAAGSGLGGFVGSIMVSTVNPDKIKVAVFIIGIMFCGYLLFSQ